MNEEKQFSRILGKRKRRKLSLIPQPPTSEEIEAEVNEYKQPLRVPKGVFRYKSHEEANADWEKWMVETMIYNAKNMKKKEI